METYGYNLPAVTYSPVSTTASPQVASVQTPAVTTTVYQQPWQQATVQQATVQQPWQQTTSTTTSTTVPQQGVGSPRMVQYERDVYTKKKKTSIVGCFPLLVFAVISMILLLVTIFIPGSATTKILALVIAMIFAIIFALLIWLTCRIVWGLAILATIIWIIMLILVYTSVVKIQT